MGFERATAVEITSTSDPNCTRTQLAFIDRHEKREKMIMREHIAIGNTRSCFDAIKVVAVLHWLVD